MKPFVTFILGAIIGVIALAVWQWLIPEIPQDVPKGAEVRRDVFIDTIPYYLPVPKDSTVLHHVTVKLPVATPDSPADTIAPDSTVTADTDSAKVIIPITQAVYEDSTYRAYVSGYRARMDSIFVYPRREVVTIKQPPKRWSIGLQAGYGYTPKGFQPYFGVGISCRLWDF